MRKIFKYIVHSETHSHIISNPYDFFSYIFFTLCKYDVVLEPTDFHYMDKKVETFLKISSFFCSTE